MIHEASPRHGPRADALPSRRAYPSNLTEAQWEAIAPMIPDARPGGRPCKAGKREIVDAILAFLRAGCAWRLLPHDFQPRRTVYCDLRRWEREGRGGERRWSERSPERARVRHALR